MKNLKQLFFATLLFVGVSAMGQIGIGTTSPNAQLDVQSSSPTSPANTDGILIPKIATFPATDPAAWTAAASALRPSSFPQGAA